MKIASIANLMKASLGIFDSGVNRYRIMYESFCEPHQEKRTYLLALEPSSTMIEKPLLRCASEERRLKKLKEIGKVKIIVFADVDYRSRNISIGFGIFSEKLLGRVGLNGEHIDRMIRSTFKPKIGFDMDKMSDEFGPTDQEVQSAVFPIYGNFKSNELFNMFCFNFISSTSALLFRTLTQTVSRQLFKYCHPDKHPGGSTFDLSVKALKRKTPDVLKTFEYIRYDENGEVNE